ncbi:alpha/beta hydrolase [Paenibacillus gallinarum]|uniref:Alpha/beta hydrolase n=1 Tax=Paenibacillus gallinarum TaxID=2762232 RepID=A0ABR8T615_9BACL|nr:alpha/beta hydrolase [Paenibacillus gallinarum]MBD7971216.1 alpha/beta hydrolase [Paenibacillus gallinarum]
MRFENISLNNKKEVVLSAYLLDNSAEFNNVNARPAVLVFPGGGYYSTSDREAEPVAMAYLAEGFNAFVLRYSTGEGSEFKAALKDAEEAIALIREKAELWGTDANKIAVVGFSAGGHLAAALGTMGGTKPNALVLGYPCILDSINLAFPIPSLDRKVDSSTPPTFLFSTFEDGVVPVEHTLRFMQALNEQNIAFESHIFQKGVHGLSVAKPLSSSGVKSFVDKDFAQWFGLSVSWLHKVLGDFQADKESLIPDAEEVKEYSSEVMLGALLDYPACRNLLVEYIPAFADKELVKGVRPYSLSLINRHLPNPLSKESLLELDKRLKAIPYIK